MTVRDDLIAAKKLIDTPEKWKSRNKGGSALTDAAEQVGRSAPRVAEIIGALTDQKSHPDWLVSHSTHAGVMALFNRAIEAAS